MTSNDARERPLRSDAERNRQRILTGAAELFALRGLEVSLDDIAAHAGVGVGTVYRRFADKDALIEALFVERIGEVQAAAERALEVEDPWDGFERFLRDSSALHAADRGLTEVFLSGGRGHERVARARDRVAPLAARLVERAREDGRLRDDFDAFDVPIMQLMLSAVADATRDVAPETWERFLGILIDGIRTRRDVPTALPADPLDADQFAAVRHGTNCPR